MANFPPGGGYPPGGGPPGYPPGGYPPGGAPPGQPGQPGAGGPQGYGPPGAPGGYGQQPMGGPPMGGMPMGGPPMGGAPMGGPPMGGAPMGGPPMGGMPMGGMPMGPHPMGGAPMGGMPMGAPPMGAPGGAMGAAGAGIGGVLAARAGFSMMKLVLGGIAAVVIAGVVGVVIWWGYTHPGIRIVNTTGRDGVSVYVDGEVLASNLRNAAVENGSLARAANIKAGQHKIEAKDSSGKVIETVNFDFKAGSNGFLYAPQKNPKVCFIIQTDEYKTNSSMPDTVKDRFQTLDRTKTIWEMPSSIDYWFQDSPESVTIKQKKGSSSSRVIKRSVRQANCDDPAYRD